MIRRRGQAYGSDLRDRVLAATSETIRAVAVRFSVSPSYVSKVRARLRETGQVTPGPQHNHVARGLSHITMCCVRELVRRRMRPLPSSEPWMAREHGVAVSHPVMWETLRRLNLTLKESASARRSRIGRTLPRHAPPGATCSQSSMLHG